MMMQYYSASWKIREQFFPEGDVVSSLEEAEEFLEENFCSGREFPA